MGSQKLNDRFWLAAAENLNK